ncbi:hypothetical protein CSHISOI_05772, partial [Colletotrichum shisoi]
MSGSRPSLALQSLDKISANRSISPSHQDGNQDGLKHALAVFQATLTDGERAKLQSLKGTSRDADSVITFTADLDRANPARKGRSIATRLFLLLQIVQQFNQIVDTHVSSHPEIAALVWGSVKLAFTVRTLPVAAFHPRSLRRIRELTARKVLANFTSYFQQFSDLLRGFDRLCPSFHGEMKPYVDDVRWRAEHVQAEISLAKAQADQEEHLSQAEERCQAAETRKGLAKWFSQSEKQVGRLRHANEATNNERKWETLLAKLSSYDYASAFKIAREKRHLGTAEWVFDEAQFQEWYTCEKSSMLHIMGKIGSGKTILTKLPETFDRALQRIIANGNEEIAQSIFKWTAVVRQPLMLEQLKEALSVEPLQEYSRPDRFVNGIDRLSVWCENLVQIEYSDETVRFSHHSILKYMLEPASGPLEAFHFDYDGADSAVGSLCLTYLDFNDIKSALMDLKHISNRLPVVNPADLAGTVVKLAVSGPSGVRIARLVKSSLGKSTPYSVPIPLPTPSQATSSGNATKIVQTEYPFLEYAKSHCEYVPWWDPEWRPSGIRTFDRSEWLDYLEYVWPTIKADESPPPELSASNIALHKAVVYADSIDNHVLLERLLTNFVDRSQPISPY